MSKTKTKQKMNRAAYKEHCWGLAFVAPPFIGFCIFMAFPIVFALIASMTKWNGIRKYHCLHAWYSDWNGTGYVDCSWNES